MAKIGFWLKGATGKLAGAALQRRKRWGFRTKILRKTSFPLVFYSLIRNFAIKKWRGYSVSAKKRKNFFVLLSTFRNFATFSN